MFKIISFTYKSTLSKIVNNTSGKLNARTFLSQAYYCQEVWEHRLNSPILQKVNLEELFYDLDQRFLKTNQISAIDVDIFANAVNTESYVDELLDLVHKLRLSADSCNTLDSTTHAVVRLLLELNRSDELINALDDRLNYGLFLDYYTANILLDSYWKNNEFTFGARVATQLMLQEEYQHPVSKSFALLHCYKYLLKPIGWPVYSLPEEPEEEVKIRVKFLRNPYFDDHFDLRDANKLVGKTLAMFTEGETDSLNCSLNILGWGLYEKQNKVDEVLEKCKNDNLVLCKEIIELLPNNNIPEVNVESVNVESLLKNNVEKSVLVMSENDIANQCKIFDKWEFERTAALEEQKQRLLVAKRLDNIKDLQASLKDKETKLWFFENEEQIELDIESKKVYYPKRWFGKKKKPKKIDADYVPPELFSKQSNN